MNPTVKYFTIASLSYLLLGAFLGLVMAIYPPSEIFLLLPHIHFLLLGFIAMQELNLQESQYSCLIIL